MIITNNAVYLHLPKTGGTWVREALRPVLVEWHDHKVLTERVEKPVYVFARNPWAWHVSMYYFLQNGSEHFNPNSKAILPPIIQALPQGHTFDTFVRAITNPTDKFKKLVYSIFQMRTKVYNDRADTAVVENQILNAWQTSPVGYCQHIYNTYTEFASRIGTNENLREDLLSMTESCGDLTEQVKNNINSLPPLNVTGLNDTRSYYTDELVELVRESCKDIINKHGYEF